MKTRRSSYPREARSSIRKRTALVVLLFVAAFAVLFYRCLYLHLAPDRRLEKLAKKQYQTTIPQVSPRGTITDARGEGLAVSVPTVSLAVRPAKVASPEVLASLLSRTLALPRSKILERLKSDKKYVWIERNLAPDQVQSLKKIEEPGLEWVNESKRFYPNRELAGQILGAVGIDGTPLGGLELAYNEILEGKVSGAVTYRDARGRIFQIPQTLAEVKGEEPHDIRLTLNKSIQFTLETELAKACQTYRAKSCTGIVMDPRSGAILAMASLPSFDPNNFGKYGWSRWKNRAITDGFEPGSIFKVILAAAALESGLVAPEDRFFCENGSLKVGKHLIHDHAPHGMLTFRQILKVSSNIGFFKIGQRVGKGNFAKMIGAMGFGRKSGVDFPGEEPGQVRSVSIWQPIDFANISFGQGVRVTPLQILRAFAVIASGGMDVTPHFVSQVRASEGEVVWDVRTPPRRILQERTAATLIGMLGEVTHEGGTGAEAAIPGYRVAGKTGTAQKPEGGRYSHDDFVSSFVGFAPLDNPQVAALIAIDEPRGAIYGGVVAAPVFRNVVWNALHELGIAPHEGSGPPRPQLVKAGLMSYEAEPVPPALPVPPAAGQVPNFMGLSMREVLQLVDETKVAAELEGSGVAYAQEPAPGTRLEEGRICRIFLRTIP